MEADGTAPASELDLALSHRLVAARTRFVQLSRQSRRKQLELAASAQARNAISTWDLDESIPDRQARLEERLRTLEAELDKRRTKHTISQGAIFALDQSLLVNSHLQSFDSPPLPARHALVQRHIVERDRLSFVLLKIGQELSEVSSRYLQVRKQITATNRENSLLVKALRTRYRSSSDIMASAPPSLLYRFLDLEDDILLLQTRLTIISPVLQTLIAESSLAYFSPTPLSRDALKDQLEARRATDDMLVDGETRDVSRDMTSSERWMGLVLLAGGDWTAEWDPLVEGAGTEKYADSPEAGSDE